MKSLLNNKMSASLRKTAVLAAAVASLSFAGTSWADSITIQYQGLQGSSGSVQPSPNGDVSAGVGAGLMNFKVINPTSSVWGSDLQAFCIDINTWLVTDENATYNIVSADGAGGLSSLQLTQVSWLFNNHSSALTSANAADKAAFQLTLWEMLFETSINNPFNLTTGNFQVTSGFEDSLGTANDWLKSAPTVAGDVSSTWKFFVLNPFDPVENQRLISWCNTETDEWCDPYNPNEVSEPATLLLLSAGLGMIFFSARRRSLRV